MPGSEMKDSCLLSAKAVVRLSAFILLPHIPIFTGQCEEGWDAACTRSESCYRRATMRLGSLELL